MSRVAKMSNRASLDQSFPSDGSPEAGEKPSTAIRLPGRQLTVLIRPPGQLASRSRLSLLAEGCRSLERAACSICRIGS